MDTLLNILVVEDHDDLREATVATLVAMGHAVHGVDCAEALDDALVSFRPDLLLLDLNLPGEDGLSIARRMRAAAPEIGIIMVTARNQVRDVTQGYSSGADIYVTKPTAPEELSAAIHALARRLRPPARAGTQLVLNTHALQLEGPQASIAVSGHEYQLLAALARARDHRLETWQLLELLGKPIEEQEKRTLAVQIVRLRKKLLDAGASEPTIKALRGTGYQLCIALELR
ncbi:MAG: response regulator transcription factor [Rhodocyclaceae bacterium]|nr:response regulator transcription factor [Rhodocyclaceae bacterium]MDZ4214644.1 response regulator transcription factor [Rhodocyclaceae bacterium]